VASNRNDQDGITRRDFTTRVGAAAAGIAVGGGLFGTRLGAQTNGRVLGANDRVQVAVIGIRGQGNSLKRGFANLNNVNVKTLCDIDANLADSRINDPSLKEVSGFKPDFVQDMRRVFDDKEIDAVVIATPNHWHALATIWALQAGKHVYVEKPSSHTVWEGRKMVEATNRYNKIVQVGTMNRSRPAVREAMKFIQDGGIGKVHMARGLCFKPRLSIGKYPDGPMQAGERYTLIAGSTGRPEPTYDAEYLSKVDYDLWLGPAPKRPFNRNRFHYNWHWHWDYGNGDTGNQGPHQFDIARWGLAKQEHPVKVSSMGGYFGEPASQETPDTQTALFEYPDGMILEFATRGEHTNDEGGQRVGNLFYGSKGWAWLDETGRNWGSYLGPVGEKNEKGPGSGTAAGQGEAVGLTTIEGGHYGNFIEALRANDPKILTCDVLEGHLSSTLPHLANISYRVGQALTFDPRAEKFVDNKKADALLTREYRKGFEIPKSFT
jgi:predicted dehydrogenase